MTKLHSANMALDTARRMTNQVKRTEMKNQKLDKIKSRFEKLVGGSLGGIVGTVLGSTMYLVTENPTDIWPMILLATCAIAGIALGYKFPSMFWQLAELLGLLFRWV